jgi:hypothetical protein
MEGEPMNPCGRKTVSFAVDLEAEEQEDRNRPVDAFGHRVEIAAECTMVMTLTEEQAFELAFELLGKIRKRDTVQVMRSGLIEVSPWGGKRKG